MPNYYNGDDERDELTEPDPLPCPDCGADADSACMPECGCVYCRKRELLNEQKLVRAIPAQREG